MIVAIVGTVGSGKSLSTVRTILKRNTTCFTNFNVKHDKIIRLLKDHIVTENIKGYKKNGDAIKEKLINWDFWNTTIKKHKGFDICLDEVHNVIHSRLSMSKHNVLMTMWFSQIRKMLGVSEKNNIYLVTQKLNRIDVAFRDLLDVIILCKKEKKGKKVFIHQYYFYGENCLDNYCLYKINPSLARKQRLYRHTFFLGNPYFKYYDSYELIKFGETAYV